MDYLGVLKAKHDSVERELSELRAELASLGERVGVKESQLRNLDHLIDLENGRPSGKPVSASASFVDVAHSILAAGGPLHYQQLAREVGARGTHIPGMNPAANLLAHLARDARFIRTARGTYGLQGANAPPKRKTSRRRRSVARKQVR